MIKKLALNKDTLRYLTGAEMQPVNGGLHTYVCYELPPYPGYPAPVPSQLTDLTGCPNPFEAPKPPPTTYTCPNYR